MARRHSPLSDDEKRVYSEHDLISSEGTRCSNASLSPKHAKRSSLTTWTMHGTNYWKQVVLALALPCVGLYYLFTHHQTLSQPAAFSLAFGEGGPSPGLAAVSRTCPGLRPIGLDEFDARRTELARLLSAGGSAPPAWGAYVMEPGPNSLYYLNLSQSDWYLSERPWLVAISPSSTATGDASSSAAWHLTVLTPTFELSRSQRLPFALKDPLESDTVSWVTWDEAENPYETLVQHLDELYRTKARDVVASSHGVQEGDQADKSTSSWSIHLEENVRQFVASGLADAAAAKTASLTGAREDTITKDNVHPGIRVAMADPRVRQQRMRKTDAELSIQRCAAKITIEALRAVRTQLRLGMTELEGEKLITEALESGGLTDVEAITLFGPNAALPHAKAGSKRLEDGEFALFDVTGSLFGYMSDMTRTMLPDISPRGRFMKDAQTDSSPVRTWPSERAQRIWETVHRAQEAALKALKHADVHAANVDRAARDVIAREGWERYFTHRLGHGIGLQVHEAPYLNGGNVDEPLRPGETFSNEPGVYIESGVERGVVGEVGIGVRLEDMVHKTRDGFELLSGQPLATSPWEP